MHTEIEIKKLKILACHGVLPEEKVNAQPFIFTVKLAVDFERAAIEDDLEKTVNYAAICDLLEKITTGNGFNLIESLARECAFAILETYKSVQSVHLKVEKPQAPVTQEVESLSVSVFYQREICYLALGSSMGDKKAYLDFAVEELKNSRGVEILKVSDFITTAPYGGQAQNEFLNGAVKISTFLSAHSLLRLVNAIEAKAGRERVKRWGDRTLDIDIIFYGNRIIRDENLIIPHTEYASRDFVLIPLKQICGNFVCPVKGVRVDTL